MKIRQILPFFVAIALVGCSSDDENTPPPQNDNNYFPLTTNNSWSYDNNREVQGQPPTQSEETLTVVDSTKKNDMVFYDLESDNLSEGGLGTALFSNGELGKAGDKLIYNGSFEFNVDLPGIEPIVFPVANAVIYSTTASAGTELSSFSDVISRNIDIQGTTVPLTIEYTATTTNLGVLNSRSVAGQEFEDVLSSNLVVSLKVYASISTPFGSIDVPVLAEQEVMTATNYYANHVGMIESQVSITYEFEDLTEYGFSNTPPVDIQSTQKIESYLIVE